MPAPAASDPHPAAPWSRRRYSGVVVAGMSVFFVYTGLEVGAGQWEASYCRGHLNLSAGATGLAAFGYWGALTAVRIGLAVLPRPVPPQAVVRWGSALAVLAAAAIWWQPDTAVAVIGFVGSRRAGLHLPGRDPPTPVRLGEQRAHNVISWQVGAAAAGGAGISAVIGLLIGVTSLAVLGPATTVLALIVVAAELILHRLAPRPARRPAPYDTHLDPTGCLVAAEPLAAGEELSEASRRKAAARRKVSPTGWPASQAWYSR